MSLPLRQLSALALVAAALGGALGVSVHGQSAEAAVDALFARWTSRTPGCAVGVARDGGVVLEKAYGMADLEHDAKNRTSTIFEAGSVSKQFTAAAVLLLARDGKLSLDDPVRRYLPELPDYGAPLTIRHLLTHTSGLRDWGHIAALEGWPRTTRLYTQVHVLEMACRQRALNFTPGTSWSYSNTGYNLAALLVARVSGQPFAEFTRRRIFEPLGMNRTSWRDDIGRIVAGRAVAYAEARDGFRTEMPFESAHGNGGLLTTVGDLLRWNENFTAPKVGDRSFVAELQQPGRLADGSSHGYGLGLYVASYKGVPEIGHGGITAGYSAFLARYPEQRLSVAVLCNAATANAEGYGRAVAEIYLGLAVRPAARAAAAPVGMGALTPHAGLYRETATGLPLAIVADESGLRIEGGDRLSPLSPTRFDWAGGGATLEFVGDRRLLVTRANGPAETYERAVPAHPDARALSQYAGAYATDEADAVLQVLVQGSELRLLQRPAYSYLLRPLDADAFQSALGTFQFLRDASGRVTAMRFSTDRVWDLRLQRIRGDTSK
jgi:CubicO group peptidase (beta-lactamase class C family)